MCCLTSGDSGSHGLQYKQASKQANKQTDRQTKRGELNGAVATWLHGCGSQRRTVARLPMGLSSSAARHRDAVRLGNAVVC